MILNKTHKAHVSTFEQLRIDCSKLFHPSAEYRDRKITVDIDNQEEYDALHKMLNEELEKQGQTPTDDISLLHVEDMGLLIINLVEKRWK